MALALGLAALVLASGQPAHASSGGDAKPSRPTPVQPTTARLGTNAEPAARPLAAAASTAATFTVRVIEAVKGPKAHMDPRLARMKREFRPFLGQYNQFTLVRDQTLRLVVNQSGAVVLPKGKRFGLKMLGFSAGKVRRIRYEVQLPRSRMKRSVAPGARTLDVIQSGGKLTIISTTVR